MTDLAALPLDPWRAIHFLNLVPTPRPGNHAESTQMFIRRLPAHQDAVGVQSGPSVFSRKLLKACGSMIGDLNEYGCRFIAAAG